MHCGGALLTYASLFTHCLSLSRPFTPTPPGVRGSPQPTVSLLACSVTAGDGSLHTLPHGAHVPKSPQGAPGRRTAVGALLPTPTSSAPTGETPGSPACCDRSMQGEMLAVCISGAGSQSDLLGHTRAQLSWCVWCIGNKSGQLMDMIMEQPEQLDCRPRLLACYLAHLGGCASLTLLSKYKTDTQHMTRMST